MISFRQKGDFSKLTRYLERVREAVHLGNLDKYGKMGVDALKSATPVDSGKTADSWYYEIENSKDGATISFNNSNINRGVNIAIILQYGHATGTGGWVEGRDYINPAIQPIFDEIAEKAWEETRRL
ncbi:MAG: HK97 gp10 family phage protein [Clostridiales bacterium]|nr:HK97 gp10 family phage protein [Clostridiales bacterium]